MRDIRIKGLTEAIVHGPFLQEGQHWFIFIYSKVGFGAL